MTIVHQQLKFIEKFSNSISKKEIFNQTPSVTLPGILFLTHVSKLMLRKGVSDKARLSAGFFECICSSAVPSLDQILYMCFSLHCRVHICVGVNMGRC